METSLRCIHVWVPGIQESGGIQHYSACLIRALKELFPEASIRVVSKLDSPASSAAGDGHVAVTAFGHIPSRLRTAAFALGGLFWAMKERPDLVITTHPHFVKALRLLRRWVGSPYLASAHGVEVWGHVQGAMLRGLQAAEGLLPVSEFTRIALLREGGFDPTKVIVVPDTFNEDAFAPGPKSTELLRRHGLKPDQPILLTVGRLAATEAYKGQDQVIQALAQVRRTHPEVRYIVAGKGDDEARLRQCVADAGQQDAVIFAGFVPDAELADYYRLCDTFVMPSTGEGFGIVYLEALASGRPCIVGTQDASPEAIGHGRLGFAVDPRSPSEIADAIVKLITRQHDKPWLNEPETLRREIIELYGFAAFKAHLSRALHQLLPRLNPSSSIQHPVSS